MTAPQYPGGPASSEALSRLVGQLQQQLAALQAERARLTDETAWLRQDNAVLLREVAALTAEVAGLRQTELGLQAHQRELQQSLIGARAEHAVLTTMAARGQARDNHKAVQIASQTAANARLQTRVDRSIGDLGRLQGSSGASSTTSTASSRSSPRR